MGTNLSYSNPATANSQSKDKNKSYKSPSEVLYNHNIPFSIDNKNDVNDKNSNNNNNNNSTNMNNSFNNEKNHDVKNVKNRFSLESMDPGSPSFSSNSEVRSL